MIGGEKDFETFGNYSFADAAREIPKPKQVLVFIARGKIQ